MSLRSLAISKVIVTKPTIHIEYNPIEHRLFCHATRACEEVVFSSIDVVQELISKTSTSKGLTVFSAIKDKVFKTGRKYAEDFKENMYVIFDEVLGKWNYRAIPNEII